MTELSQFQTLYEILHLKRCHLSEGESELITKYIIPTGAKSDKFGNYSLRIGTAPVMWSCHTDTVHRPNETGKQTLSLAEDEGMIFLADEDGTCLGADNGAGVWLLLEMIKAGKEGLYVFHRCEERGGRGSKHIAAYETSLVDGINYAIAFDRYGTTSIITHQAWERCCSDQFARELRNELRLLGMPNMQLDDSGVFTDTANYTHLIPECTNISVGFKYEHTGSECLDLWHLGRLKKALLALDINNLPVERDPAQRMSFKDFGNYHGQDNHDFLIANYSTVMQVLEDWGCIDIMVDEVTRRL